MRNLVSQLYLPGILEARARFARGAGAALLDPNMDPTLPELFLIHFCARGVQMTEPVESWIRRAGERCRALGAERLGRALVRHARHEANHHLMMIADTHHLVASWNQRNGPQIDAAALL